MPKTIPSLLQNCKKIFFMEKKILISFFLFSALLFVSNKAYAVITCQPVYGGGQNCITTAGNLTINKTVQNPDTHQFVDNLNINDPKFQASQIVTFQITITNTGNATISQATVKDVFPGFVNFNSGAGNFDPNTKTLTFTTNNLVPNESRTFTLQGKVTDKDLPDGTTCVVNQATAATSDNQMAQDNAQLCIQKTQVTTKGGLPVFPPTKATITPPTGPEALVLFGLLPTGVMGWILRKKSNFQRDKNK